MSILVKFVLILLGIYLAVWLLWRLFGKALARAFARFLMRKAQESMDAQSRNYQQYARDYSPFEENVYIEDDVKVSIRRGSKHEKGPKPEKSNLPIEEVDFEDLE